MRWLAGVMTGALLLGACGGDDDSAKVPDGPSEGDPRSDEAWQADLEVAQGIVLTLDDLEPGWEASPGEESAEDDAGDAKLAECLGLTLEEFRSNNPSADSDTFTSPYDEDLDARVTVLPSADDAEAALHRFRDDEGLACLRTAYRDAVGRTLAEKPGDLDGLNVGEPTLNRVSVPAMGDEVFGLRTTLPLSRSGMDVDLYVDTVVVRVGRVVVQASFTSLLSPVDTDSAVELTQVMVDRVPADV